MANISLLTHNEIRTSTEKPTIDATWAATENATRNALNETLKHVR
jgi:hypothetical protein